jgi:hypothetical protein
VRVNVFFCILRSYQSRLLGPDSTGSQVGGQDQKAGSSRPSSEPCAEAKDGKPGPAAGTAADNCKKNSDDKQSKRILWVIPSYQAVTADTQLPPLTAKGKFVLATMDSFDYSSFALAGIIAAEGEGSNSTPEFHGGAAGFGRYFWHSATDLAVGNYFTEAIVPTLAHEDPRYYALGHGGFFRRSGYALTRCLITRTDSGRRTLNLSEIVGNGLGAGVSNLYYPRQERTWSQTGQKWSLQIGIDAIFDFGMEFWPDINHHVFHDHF